MLYGNGRHAACHIDNLFLPYRLGFNLRDHSISISGFGCGLSLSQASARRTTPHTLVCSSLTATVEMCIFVMRDHFQVILRPWSVNHVPKVHTKNLMFLCI